MVMRKRVRRAALALGFFLVVSHTLAEEPPAPRTTPWEPQLRFNTQEAVCNAILAIVRNGFLSTGFAIHSSMLDWRANPSQAFEPLEWQPLDLAPRSTFSADALYLKDWGAVLIAFGKPFPRKPGTSILYFPNALSAEQYIKAISADKIDYRKVQQAVGADGVVPIQSYSWGFPEVLRSGNDLFVFTQYRDFELETHKLFRLGSDGTTSHVCSIQLYPDSTEGPSAIDGLDRRLAKRWQSGLASETVQPFGASGFYRILSDIMGGQGAGWGGTMDVWGYRSLYVRQAAAVAALRPWALSNVLASGPTFSDPSMDDVLSFLEIWSLRGPWERSRYEKLMRSIPKAQDSFRQYYIDAFGYSSEDAAEIASRAVDVMVRVFFSGATTYNPRVRWQSVRNNLLVKIEALTPETERLECAETHLRTLLLGGVPMSSLAPLLAHLAPTAGERLDVDGYESCWPFEALDPLLSYALQRLEDLARLVEWGADPNERNFLGKTPLMHASHLSDLPAARALVNLGADPNLATFDKAPLRHDVAYGVVHNNRTALMYAAENGSLDLIVFLLEAGADPSARDSQDWGVIQYLEHNESLSSSDRTAARDLLLAAGARP